MKRWDCAGDGCGRVIVPWTQANPPATWPHKGGGMCGRCRCRSQRRHLDPIALERALHGNPPQRLTVYERRAAAAELARRGLSVRETAQRLRCTTRTITRYRAQHRTREAA